MSTPHHYSSLDLARRLLRDIPYPDRARKADGNDVLARGSEIEGAQATNITRPCLSLADQECFAQALLSPPKPAPALERAFARRSKLLKS